MAAPYNPPIKGEDFVIRIALNDASDPKSFKSNPTLAAGDFKVDLDGGGLNNLATTPSCTGANVLVKITLSSTEMNGDVITVVGIDQTATKEWADFCFSIPTTT